MEKEQYYLGLDVQIEPLFNKWHVHPYLISPATTAMYVKNSHIKMMKSYVQMPMAHAIALKNPDMAGGEFIDYGGKRANEIKALHDDTIANSQKLIELKEAIDELSLILKSEAKGYPLHELYQKIPDPLKGYVELYYDLNHQPAFRLFEILLYNSEYYDTSKQSICLHKVFSDDRPFIFGTPRLEDSDKLHLDISFDDEKIDTLNHLKYEPKSLDEIKHLLNINDSDEELLKSFLTTEEPKKPERYSGDGVRVRYFGHATVLVETKDSSILVDPLISYKYDSEKARFTYEDLPDEIDYVLITHSHHDHITIETLLQLRTRIKNIIVPSNGNGNLEDPSLKLVLENIGFKNVHDLDEMEKITFRDGLITGIPFYGEHCDLNIKSKTGFLINILDESFLFLADSSVLDPNCYKHVQKIVGNVKTLFISQECTGAPMSWSYGSFFSEGLDRDLDHSRRSNGPGHVAAISLAETFSCQSIYLYAMGLEPWLNYAMALKDDHVSNTKQSIETVLNYAEENNIYAEQLFLKKEIVLSEELALA